VSVPSTQASALGLRRLMNGVATTLAVLRGNAVQLPEHPRQRVVELASRWESPDPTALAGAVRDLLGYARQFGLKAAEQQWLTRACERLGAEAARVDAITPTAARAAITQEVTRLKTPPPVVEPPTPPSAASRRRRTH
jgi:RNA polymerase-interacting CarD/CdnL/TRCF family regulator